MRIGNKMTKWHLVVAILTMVILPLLLCGCNGLQTTTIKGDKGDQGDMGLPGLQGIKGDVGETGLQGIQGLKGDTGSRGIQGDKGDKGERGLQGIQGDNLIVAMGYIYEDYANQPEGNPQIINSYGIDNVTWDKHLQGYIVTSTDIDIYSNNYITLVNPKDESHFATAGIMRYTNHEAKFCIRVTENPTQFPIDSTSYNIGSFQFVIFKYPTN